MPHSSGGGSHSSGSHGSSSYSSGKSTPSVYRTYHSGTRRYVYYQNNRPCYYYSTEKVKKPAAWELPAVTIFLIVFLLLCIPFSFYCGVITPYQLDMDYDTQIVIADNIDVITEAEEADLIIKLREFQKTTGITPAILTVKNEDWKPHYDSLENYAYDYYVNAFTDESHWLIVYSSDGGIKFDDWYWEGMQGDSTDTIINSDVSDNFNDVMQKELTARTRYTVKDAIFDSFSAILPGIMDKTIDLEFVVYMFIIVVVVIAMCLSHILHIIKANKQSNSYVCKTAKEQPLEDTCDYCGGVYVHGIHTSCPHCGAPIVALK